MQIKINPVKTYCRIWTFVRERFLYKEFVQCLNLAIKPDEVVQWVVWYPQKLWAWSAYLELLWLPLSEQSLFDPALVTRTLYRQRYHKWAEDLPSHKRGYDESFQGWIICRFCFAFCHRDEHVTLLYLSTPSLTLTSPCTQKKNDFVTLTNICDTDNCALFLYRLKPCLVK